MSAAARRREPTILDRLRAETRAEHDAIERELDWERRVSTMDGYRTMLERLHGYHAAWEPAAAAAIGDPGFFDPRRKLALLAGDVARLGGDARPRYPYAVAFGGADEALGSMYVLEGSTLGGQLIARRVRAALGFAPGYHDAYGPATGAMWRAFQARLVEVRDADAAVEGARRTFGDLRGWLTEGAR